MADRVELNISEVQAAGIEKLLANPGIKDYDVAENLSNHAFLVMNQYNNDSKLETLEQAISLARSAADAMPEDHASKLFPLNNLAAMLQMLFMRKADPEILSEATQACEKICEATPQDDSMWTGRVSNLSVMYQTQYEATGNPDYLEKCIKLMRQVVSIMSDDHWERSGFLSNLASQLNLLFKRHGHLADGDEAIRFAQQAVDSTLPGDSEGSELLNNLGVILHTYYDRNGEARLLELAVDSCRKSVAQTPQTHVALARRLTNLSSMLRSLFERTKDIHFLIESIDIAERAVNSTPDGLPEKSARHANDITTSRKAVDLYRESLRLTPEESPDHAVQLNNLGAALGIVARITGEAETKREAVDMVQAGVDGTAEDHPHRGRWLVNLGSVLEVSVRDVNGAEVPASSIDIERAIACYIESFESLHTAPVDRVLAARNAIRVLARRERWEHARRVAESAMQLLPIICGRQAARRDQQNAAIQVSGLAADTCSLLLKMRDAAKAVQWLEFGRGLILGYMIDSKLERSELSSLRQHHGAIAERYDTLRLQAQTPFDLDDPAGDALRHQRWLAIRDMAVCLADIRKIDGYERFLLEPDFSELKVQALDGPIIIVNLTDLGTDAIIVTPDGADVVQLAGPNAGVVPKSVNQAYTQFANERSVLIFDRDISGEDDDVGNGLHSCMGEEELKWLWNDCVKPVINRMGEKNLLNPGNHDDNLSHVWWIGSGIATGLPFHAAQAAVAASDNDDHVIESALDRMIPSYVPTIKSLVYSRSLATKSTVLKRTLDANHVLVVAMPTTPGQQDLKGADCEAEAIRNIFKSLSPCKVLRLPTAEEVLARIPGSAIVHFACHGFADPIDPSRSRFILQRHGEKGPVADSLTFSMISNAAVKSEGSWLAFLSACSTAAVQAVGLEEESLHLATAFQMAGFPHAVGALWPTDDNACTRIAELFYDNLIRMRPQGGLGYADPSSALRKATLQLRSEFPEQPSIWAPFIHIGA
ncbi:hypothetical protein PV08_03392 [Exophiala spinifera]|uniref:CHAT domain-containing protein n=1 Tax=Exophiala spinifera TaxID=91928 RepID=A0A0D2BKK5_9EURO|nr:uncharacterized protein PV08_03392 [Exophiala spinifera]KIW19100.1 hypothetical protein PV08_03392 [Exophiala spinifera]